MRTLNFPPFSWALLVLAIWFFIESDVGEASIVQSTVAFLAFFSRFDPAYRWTAYVAACYAITALLPLALSAAMRSVRAKGDEDAASKGRYWVRDWRILGILAFSAFVINPGNYVESALGIANEGRFIAYFSAFVAFFAVHAVFVLPGWWKDHGLSNEFVFSKPQRGTEPKEARELGAYALAFSVLCGMAFAIWGASIGIASLSDHPIAAYFSVIAAFPLTVTGLILAYLFIRRAFPFYYVADFWHSVSKRPDFQAWTEVKWMSLDGLSPSEKMTIAESFYRWKFAHAKNVPQNELAKSLRKKEPRWLSTIE